MEHERRPQRFDEPCGDLLRLVVGVALEQDPELVAAETRRDVARANACADTLGSGDEQIVAGAVAEPVVDRLEVVEVEEEHRRVVGRPACERLADAFGEEPAVRQAGERVVVGLVAELLLDRSFSSSTLAWLANVSKSLRSSSLNVDTSPARLPTSKEGERALPAP